MPYILVIIHLHLLNQLRQSHYMEEKKKSDFGDFVQRTSHHKVLQVRNTYMN